MLKIHITPEVRDHVADCVGSELADWWIAEYERRAHVGLAEALEEQVEVSIENFKAEHRPIEGLGQCMFRIGAKLDAWLHAYCPGYVYDEAFIRQLMIDNQHLCFKPTYKQKAQIIVEKPEEAVVIVSRNPAPRKDGATILHAA